MLDLHERRRITRSATRCPLIVLVVPRGEAVRNFLFSDTLSRLCASARVVVLSVITNEEILQHARPFAEQIIPIKEHRVRSIPAYLRSVVEHAHDRCLWSKVAQNNWEIRSRRAQEKGVLAQLGWMSVGVMSRILGNEPTLRVLTAMEQYAQWRLRTTREYDELFSELRPDLVFNASHIHGFAGELPVRVAQRMGIKTAGFIFSWDNLTSRSRVVVPYDYWFVWHDDMKQQLLKIYPSIKPESVFVTGTPQFDFHFNPKLVLSRVELCRRIGIDPSRAFVLYTTGIDRHFPREHLHVESVIRLLREFEPATRPQLVVRNYIKGTSPEMTALAKQSIPDVVFPPMLWDTAWATPKYEDLELYCSLLSHAAVGINAASTVTLELMLKDKPVINLDFDPPGSRLEYCDGFQRHIRFDHFRAVAESGATLLARSEEDMRSMLRQAIECPQERSQQRKAFLSRVFGHTLDGMSGCRTADQLLRLATEHSGRRAEAVDNTIDILQRRSAERGIREASGTMPNEVRHGTSRASATRSKSRSAT